MYIKISILGSTGSIGLHTLNLISRKKKLFKINVLSANKNFNLICRQIKKLNPTIFIVNDFQTFLKVKRKFKNKKTKIFNGLNEISKNIIKSDITIAAIPGIAGLEPTIKFTQMSKKILIANKESIICGWDLIKRNATINKTKIIPIDSEHFSIMQLLNSHEISEIKKIYITASGGPFLRTNLSKLKKIKPSQALKHPKWKMGKKISIDSATLMNKMLEVMEAQKLFALKSNKIEIIIHPESLVHAIVELKNGLSKFIYHETTMLIPLANAIFEKSISAEDYSKLKLTKTKSTIFEKLNFLKVEKKRFPLIKLKERFNEHKSSPIIINAINEILVDQFLKKKIGFTSFYNFFLKVLNDSNYIKYAIKEPKNISEVLQIDQWSRNKTLEKIKNV